MPPFRFPRVLMLCVLVATSACARPAAEPPAGVLAPELMPLVTEAAGEIPPPRAVPPAAEPIDARNAMEVFVIAGGGGVWKFQYSSGQREMNSLHLPVGKPVKLTLTAERPPLFGIGWNTLDVPAFPLAAPAWAGRYTSVGLKPIRTGEFGIRYGSDRVGTVTVLEVAAFERFLAGTPAVPVDESPAGRGRELFLKLQCVNCHNGAAAAKAPNLEGLFGRKVALQGGGTTTADEAYIVESIRKPRAKAAEGWEKIMPAYDEEQVSAEEMNALLAYIKSLKPGGTPGKEERFPPPVGAPTEPKK